MVYISNFPDVENVNVLDQVLLILLLNNMYGQIS